MQSFSARLVAGLLALVEVQAWAQDSFGPDGATADSRDPFLESGTEKDHLTGDWWGARTWLFERGVHLQLGYIWEGWANVEGGIRRSTAHEGLGEMALELDLEKLTGLWPGGTFRASALWLHRNRGPSSFLVGDALGASNIEGHDSLRLYELWLEQKFFAETFSIRAGSLLADEEFADTGYGGLLMNSAFGWPAFISGNVINTGPAFYVAAPGVRLRVEPTDEFYVQAGVYDGDSFDSPFGDPHVNESGTRFQLDSEQGAFVLSELGYRFNHAEDSTGLPGTYKLGFWVHTGKFPGAHEENFGAYIAAEQMLWREDAASRDQGLGVFLRGGGSPPDRSAFAFVIDTGVHYTGLIPGRDADRAALGFIHADFSRARGGHNPLRDFEQVVEFTYEFEVTPWWTIQPDAQWINNPGGKRGNPDAVLLGLRTTVAF